MINVNLIDSTITNQRTQRLEVPPPQAADIGGQERVDAHDAAIEPIGVANTFPWKVPASMILVHIYQKQPHS